MLWLPAVAPGAEVPDYEERPAQDGGEAGARQPFVRVWLDAERRVVVEDRANQCRLRLPGPYWECRTAEQVAAEGSSGGCAPAAAAPAGMLCFFRSKDAPAGGALHLLPDRFLLRGKEDVEDYVNAQLAQFKQRAGGEIEPLESSYIEPNGLIAHRALLTQTIKDQKRRYLLAHYFVRPAGEDVRVYWLICAAAEDAFETQRRDFDYITRSFEFTGDLSQEFFSRNVPQDRLPGFEAPSQPAPGCGGGYSGLLIAFVGVVFVYLMIRRRSRPTV